MIDRRWYGHKAEKWLQMVIDCLEAQSGEPDRKGYRAELLQDAYCLWMRSPDVVAALFFGDQGEFDRQLEERPDEIAAVLAEGMAQLESELERAGDDAACLLVENLFNTLYDDRR